MSVFSTLYRRRTPILILIIWLITVYSFGNKSAYSQLSALSDWASIHKIEVIKKTSHSVTDNVRKIVLENGLTVLTKEVHTAPVVTVQAWYKVGSRNEEPGVNGIAHQLEHMMFRGTKDRPIQFGRLLSALGSDSNAFTNYDQTAYYNTVERDKLKALLVLEADRMQNALIDAKKLSQEKRIVISELQGYENSPDYRLNRAVMRAAFPNHPYGLPIGGTKADVEKFQVEEVQKYYHNFYNPNNAVVVIVGDFSTEPTLQIVKEIFEKIPKGVSRGGFNTDNIATPPKILTNPPLQKSEVNNRKTFSPSPTLPLSHSPIVLREPGAGALLQAVYPLPDVNNPDVPALDVMDSILTEGRNSRLKRVLVESGLASDVTGYVVNLLELGWYQLSVVAFKTQDLRKIDSALSHALAEFSQKEVTQQEVSRAKRQLEATVTLGNRDINNLAMQLGNDETTAGDYRYTTNYLAALRQVTTADVQRVANKYLKQEARTVGFFEPTEIQKNGGSKANSTRITENFSNGAPVSSSDVAKYLPPVNLADSTPTTHVSPQHFRLRNGLQVLLLPSKNTPTVTLSGYIKAGTEFDPEGKAGLAALVSQNLVNGTKTKDVFTIAKALEERGASLNFEPYREGVQIQGSGLAVDLPVLVQTLADVVKNSTFPEKELELSREKALTALAQDLDDPSEVAKRTFIQSVYPKQHPLHQFATKKSLQFLSRQDVIAFKAKHYRPDTTVLALVGDFVPAEVRLLIKAKFGDWKASGSPPTLKYPRVLMPNGVVRVNPILPGKAEAITYMGNIGINRKDSRFYAAMVLNQILGGDTLSSRLGAEVRDRQGLTYGIYSDFNAGRNFGTFSIEIQTSPEDTTQAITSTQHLLQQIHQNGVTPLEVKTAIHNILSNYTVSLANVEELARRVLMNEVYGLDQEELRLFTEKIQAITVAQVNQAARELLHPDKIVVVTAGPSMLANQDVKMMRSVN
ncbi:MAG: pitrilysin family protein [Rhizonema sp. PD37]|nr:pitrilysin family protein [Rhizonema sp. PD37]